MTVGILVEKNSAARNFAAALGASSTPPMKGSYAGEDFIIVASRGHLYQFVDPEKMVPAAKAESYSKWDLANLPWDASLLTWERVPSPGAGQALGAIADGLRGVDEIVIATDVDPTGEGQLLAWEILEQLPPAPKYTRMYFADESPASLQKAFKERKEIVGGQANDGEFLKADYRSKFDFLSIQWTRAATKILESTGRRAVLRNGRLKSAMVRIVADGIEAYDSYEKVPYYENRFKDDHGVVYSNPDEPRFKVKADVPQSYTDAHVEHVGTQRKQTAPPKLLDLAGLSSILVRKGAKASTVLEVYQKMYEDQVVSYPRTEDKFVSHEQFNELLPKIDAIAGVVGIDPAVLTQRGPRKTHVKDGGAHGANRPGPRVPASLDAVEKKYGKLGRDIYEVLAKNYLTMLAENYVYDLIQGRIKEHPEFTGSLHVPVSRGWKDVFNAASAMGDDEDEVDTVTSLGSTASPFIHEGFPPRPPKPTMTWLMKQLERYDVGTGATRTNTYGEITQGSDALLADTRGTISMTSLGVANAHLIKDTYIGNVELTEHVYAEMDGISEERNTDKIKQSLEAVAKWVEEDIATMQKNAATMPDDMATDLKRVLREKATGIYVPENIEVTFNREFGGYRFSDEEVDALLRGDEIEFDFTSKGVKYHTTGTLQQQVFEAKDGKQIPYWGYKGDIERVLDPSEYARGEWVEEPGEETVFKRVYRKTQIPDADVATLFAGGVVRLVADNAKGVETEYALGLKRREYNGRSYVGVLGIPASFGTYKFSDDELKTLFAHKVITFDYTPEGKQPIPGVKGKLAQKEYNGRKYIGFDAEFPKRSVDTTIYAVGRWVVQPEVETKFKRSWGGHDFDDDEIAKLFGGETIEFEATSKKSGKNYKAKGKLAKKTFADSNGKLIEYVGFDPIFDKKDK